MKEFERAALHGGEVHSDATFWTAWRDARQQLM